MRHGRWVLALAALAAGGFVSACGSGGAEFDTAKVEAAVTNAMERHAIPGVGIAVVTDFEVVWAAGYGEARPGRDVDEGTLFQAASLSKPVSAMIIADLAEEGVVDLDADVASMLTRWELPPTRPGDVITLAMLLGHTGGFNKFGLPGYPQGTELPPLPAVLDGGERVTSPPVSLIVQPGSEYIYSNGGFMVAQLAVEDVTGVDFADLADMHVLEPLGLGTATFHLLDPDSTPEAAFGYRPDGVPIAAGWHDYAATAAGSLWATPTEYAEIVIDMMRSYRDDTGVVIDGDTARTMLTPGRSVGFGVSEEQGGIAIGHEGRNEGFEGSFRALPELGDAVVVMTNSDEGMVLADEIVDVVAEALHWPWTGWSTPLWLFLVEVAVVVVAGFLAGRWWKQRRE